MVNYLEGYNYNSVYEDGYTQGCATSINWLIKIIEEYIEVKGKKTNYLIYGDKLLTYIKRKAREDGIYGLIG